MKFLLIFISLTLFGTIYTCASNDLRMYNIDITPPGQSKLHFSFKYESIVIKHKLIKETETDIEAVFKFIWNYQDDHEKEVGHGIFADMSKHLNGVSEDNGLIVAFQAQDLKKLKIYKKNEFGEAYAIDAEQNGIPVSLQFQVKANQPNSQDLHDLIVKVLDKKKGQQLDFLQYLEEYSE
jgi:hypothetical protein